MSRFQKAKPVSGGARGGGKVDAVSPRESAPAGAPKRTWSERAPKGNPIDSPASRENSRP